MATNGELIFVGGYTRDKGGEAEGIGLLRRDPVSGVLSPLGLAARTPSPSFLAQHPTLPVLYAVNELDTDGTVSAFSVSPDGELSELAVRATGGADPAHLAVTPDGGHLLVANYTSGSVSVHPLDSDGVPAERSDLLRLHGEGPVAGRQEGPHAHMVYPRADDLLVADLGSDTVWRCRLDRTAGRLIMVGRDIKTRAGTGPRHLCASPDGLGLLLVGELDGMLSWYRPTTEGLLVEEGREPTSTREEERFPSEIIMRPDGRFVYVANRGPDTVATFAWEGSAATAVAETWVGGHWPRHMTLLGDHLYVANQMSHSVTTLRINAETGVPERQGEFTSVASPTCLLRWVRKIIG